MITIKKISIAFITCALLGICSLVSSSGHVHLHIVNASSRSRSINRLCNEHSNLKYMALLNNRYDKHQGIEYIKFNHNTNHLTIYLKSQKHNKTHYYSNEPMPVTEQAEHAIKLGEHIKNVNHDSGMVTVFKTGHLSQQLSSCLIKILNTNNN